MRDILIAYSSRAARAIGYLKRPYNDIEIYVEDSSSHAMWLRIIQRLIPEGVKLSSVNALNGRETVIDACKKDQRVDGRKRLYIIDGDFDYLKGRPKKRLKWLYRLRAYCVENLLISESCLCEVAIDSSGIVDLQIIKRKLNIAGILTSVENSLRLLFYNYAAAHECCPTIQTVAFSAMKLTTQVNERPVYDVTKIRKRIADIIRCVRAVGENRRFAAKRRQYIMRGKDLPTMMVVSGKDYLFPFIYQCFRKEFQYSGNKEQFKVSLAKLYLPSAEPYFARRLRKMWD